MRVLDIFSGVGGMSLGLNRAGFETVAFCELPENQAVIRKHWSDVPIYDDIKELTYERLQADGIVSDTISFKQRAGKGYQQQAWDSSANDTYLATRNWHVIKQTDA